MVDEAGKPEFSNDQVKALFEMRPGLSEVVERLGIDTTEISAVASRGADMNPENAPFGRCVDLNTRPHPNTPVEFNLGMDNPERRGVDRTISPPALAVVVGVESAIGPTDNHYILPIVQRIDATTAVIITAKVSASEFERLEAQAAAWRKGHPKEEKAPVADELEKFPSTGDGKNNLFNPKPSRVESLNRLRHTERVAINGGEFEINDGQRVVIGSHPHDASAGEPVDGCIWIEESHIPEATLALTLGKQGNVTAEALSETVVYLIRGGIYGGVEQLNGTKVVPKSESDNTRFLIETKDSELIMLRPGTVGGSGVGIGTENERSSLFIQYRTEKTDMESVRKWAIK